MEDLSPFVACERHRGKAQKHQRGNMQEFFDPAVTAQLQRPRTATASLGRQQGEARSKISATVSNGQLHMNGKALKEECTKEFRERWFFKTQDYVYPVRMDNIEVFDVKQPVVRPATAQARERRAAMLAAGIDLNGVLEQPSFASSTDPSLHSLSRPRPIKSVSVWDSLDVKMNSKQRTVTIKSKPSEDGSDPQRKAYEHQVRALGALTRQRKTLSRVHQQQPEAISADYVLFVECLRKNVLPYAARRLDTVGHKQCERSNHFSPENVEDRDVVTLHDLDEMAEDLSQSDGSESIVNVRHDMLTIEHSAVVVLNLSNRGLGPDRGVCLSQALQYCPALTVAKLGNNRLNDFSALKIVNALLHYTSVTSIDLSDNGLGPLCIGSIVDNLQSASCQLQELDLGRCGLTDELAGLVGAAMVENCTVATLRISSANIGSQEDKWATCWPSVLQHNRTLQSLDLSGNFIGRALAVHLFAKLSDNRTLTELNLSHNQMSDIEGSYCGLSVEANPMLTSLDLSNNRLGSKGCIALAYCCSQETCGIRLLDLSGQVVSERAALFALRCMVDVATRIADHVVRQPDQASEDESTVSITPRTLNIACQATMKVDDDMIDFDPLLPGGTFDLDLSDPFHRVIAKIALTEADCNPQAKIACLKWWNPLFNSFEHVVLHRQNQPAPGSVPPYIRKASLPSSPQKPVSAVEEFVSLLILLSRKSDSASFANDANVREAMEAKVGIRLTEDLLKYLRNELKFINFMDHGTPVLECYTLILSWIFEYIREGRSAVDVQQLASHEQLLHIYQRAVNTRESETSKQHSISVHTHKFLSELGLNDLISIVSKADFLRVFLQRSVCIHHPILVEKHVSQATRTVYSVPTMGRLSIDISLPMIDGIQSKRLSRHGFGLFIDSFMGKLPKTYDNLIGYLHRVLDAREHALYLSLAQAEHLLALLDKSYTSFHSDFVEKLLYQLRNATDRRRLLIRNLYFHEVLLLRKKMGYLFNAMVGAATGHYYLDLSDAQHRKSVFWLWRRFENERLTVSFPPGDPENVVDVSQAGDGSGFRNCSYNGTHLTLSWDWCQHMPAVGKLRFDFVSLDRTAAVMPQEVLLDEVTRVTAMGRRGAASAGAGAGAGSRGGGGSAASSALNRSGFELLVDIVFSSVYVKQLRKIARKQNLGCKNGPSEGIAEVKKTILQGFAQMNAPPEVWEEGVGPTSAAASSSESEDDNYEEDDGEEEDEGKEDKRGTTLGNKSSSMIRMISQAAKDQPPSPNAPKRRTSMFFADPALTSTSSKKKKKKKLVNQVHNSHVVRAMDLWLDYSLTSWDRYKQAHSELLQSKAEVIYREMLKESGTMQRSETSSKEYPQQVYASPAFQALLKQPIYQTSTFATKRRGAVVKPPANLKVPLDQLMNTRLSSSAKRGTLTATTLTRASKAAADGAPDPLLGSSTSCAKFEGMLLNLEICLLYNIWLETTHVKKLLELFVQKHAPIFVLMRAIAILFRVVVDLENLSDVVYAVCGPKVHLECVHRLGVLNYCSVHSWGYMELDLASRDHQVAALTLMALARKDYVQLTKIRLFPCLVQTPTTLEVDSLLRSSATAIPSRGCLFLIAKSRSDLDFSDEVDCEEDSRTKALEKVFLAALRPSWS